MEVWGFGTIWLQRKYICQCGGSDHGFKNRTRERIEKGSGSRITGLIGGQIGNVINNLINNF